MKRRSVVFLSALMAFQACNSPSNNTESPPSLGNGGAVSQQPGAKGAAVANSTNGVLSAGQYLLPDGVTLYTNGGGQFCYLAQSFTPAELSAMTVIPSIPPEETQVSYNGGYCNGWGLLAAGQYVLPSGTAIATNGGGQYCRYAQSFTPAELSAMTPIPTIPPEETPVAYNGGNCAVAPDGATGPLTFPVANSSFVAPGGIYFTNGQKSACQYTYNMAITDGMLVNRLQYPYYFSLSQFGLQNQGVCQGTGTSLPAEVFFTSDGTVYYSNGAGHSCSFQNVPSSLSFSGVAMYPSFPSDLSHNDGVCAGWAGTNQYPATSTPVANSAFITQGGIYFTNGQTVCQITYDQAILDGMNMGHLNLPYYPSLSQLGRHNDGVCGGGKTTIPAGLFTTADGTIYTSNGNGHACSYKFTGGLEVSGLLMYPSFPSDLIINDGQCATSPYTDIKSYGAKGDGVTDDSQAFNCATGSIQGSQCAMPPTPNIYVSPGNYLFNNTVLVTLPNSNLVSDGATLKSSSTHAILQTNGTANGTTLKGLNFNFTGTNSSVVVITASNNQVLNNYFYGNCLSSTQGCENNQLNLTANTGVTVSGNVFDGSIGLGSVASGQQIGPTVPITANGITNFQITNNLFYDTAGFGISTLLGTKNGIVSQNVFNAPTRQLSLQAKAGQTVFNFTFPTTIFRVGIQVNGVPTAAPTSTPDGRSYTVTLPTAPPTGAMITLLGWRALEQLQANSQSFDITFSSNSINGSGDTCIDVVSDYHLSAPLATALSTANQSVFKMKANMAPTDPVFVTVNGEMSYYGASINSSGLNYTVTFATPLPAGQTVNLVSVALDNSASVSADYPARITIAGNTVSNCLASGISSEIAAPSVWIAGNTISNTGLGVTDVCYSSGIFITGCPTSVTGNSISNSSQPTAQYGVSVFPSSIGCATISSNSFSGSFIQDIYDQP